MELLVEIQNKKALLVKENNFLKNPRIILAVTVYSKKDIVRGGGILYDLILKTQISSWITTELFPSKPYISTFLSIRNKAPVTAIIKHFWTKFDVVLIEGAGIQHPRYCGLASEVGVDLDIPTIGVTRQSLFGTIDFSQALDKFQSEFEINPILDKNKQIGYFIRKITNKRGIHLSIGHLFTLDSALNLIVPLLKFRLPEPLRLVKQLLIHRMKI